MYLAVDTTSPLVSVALGDDHTVLACESLKQAHSAEALLPAIDAVLRRARLELGQLDGVVALQGPGSFTGIRIGLAVVLGFHQTLGLAATALPTLPVLAAAAAVADGGSVLAAVDALRGRWFVQRFTAASRPLALGPPLCMAEEDLAALGADVIVGFGTARLLERPGWPAHLACRTPGPLAAVAVRLAAQPDQRWQPAALSEPLYLREPSVTLDGTVSP